MGSIGNINVEFSASTGNLTAGLRTVGEGLAATGAKAQAAGDQIARAIDRGTVQGQRMIAMMQRQKVAAGQAADADMELARAHEMAALKADILSRANERLADSAVPVGRAYMGMSAKVSESLDAMGEKIAATAEKAQLSSDGVVAGFGAMGTALGVGIAGEMVGHFLDDTAESLAKIRDVAMVTKMSIQSLAGLQAVAQGMGLPFQTIAKGIQMMSAAQVGAAMEWKDTSNEQVASFKALGITLQEIQHDTPEQMFYRLTTALHNNTDATLTNAAARRIFGKGATSTLAVIDEYGNSLQSVTKKLGEESGYTDAAGESAKRWLVAMRQLSLEIHSMAIPALEGLVSAIPYVKAGFYGMGIAIEAVFSTIANSAVTAVKAIAMVGKAGYDAAHFNVGAIEGDFKQGYASIASGWHQQASDIAGFRKSMDASWASRGAAADVIPAAGPTDLTGLTPVKKMRAGHSAIDHETSQETAMQFWSSVHKPSRIERAQERVRHAPLPPRAVDFHRADPQFAIRMAALNQHGAMTEAENQHSFSLAQIEAQQKSGQMTRYQASVARAAINAKEFADRMSILNDRLAKINSITDNTLTADQRALQSKQIMNEQEDLLGKRHIQQLNERYDAMRGVPVTSSAQGLSDYLGKYNGSDIAGRMAPQTLSTANESVARLMTTGTGNFAGMFRGLATSGATNALGGIENHYLKGPLGTLLGKKTTPTGTASDPMYVKMQGSPGGTTRPDLMKTTVSSVTSLLPPAAGAGGILSTIGGTLMKAIPFISGFLATGGPVSSGLSYMVGEKGPELFTPSGSGTIIPNHKLSQVGGGGSGSTAIHVDARGAMDPAATMVAVQRGITMMGHQAVKQSMHAAQELKARTPR